MKDSKIRILLNTLIFLSACISIALDFFNSPYYGLGKSLTTILVILLPVLAKGKHTVFKRTLIVALCFCLLGDVLLLNPSYFVYGLAAFLMAHLLFVKGFVGLIGWQKNPTVALTLLVIGIALYAWLYPDLAGLVWPVAFYVLVILCMAWQGIALYLKEKTRAHGLIALGVLFFLFSDSMIAVSKFKNPFELSGLIVLSTYWLAIALIANAIYYMRGSF